jgi:hypothetical protein
LIGFSSKFFREFVVQVGGQRERAERQAVNVVILARLDNGDAKRGSDLLRGDVDQKPVVNRIAPKVVA